MKILGKKKAPDEELAVANTENAETNGDNAPQTPVDPSVTDPTNPKYKVIIKNKHARRLAKERKIVIIIAILLLVLALIGMLVYGFYSAVEINNFSIYVDSEGSRVLSLSETSHFVPGTQHLEIKGPEHMDNTSLYLCPTKNGAPIKDKLVEIVTGDGQQSTKDDHYFASSFYLKNVTDEVQFYNEFFKIKECTKGVEEALRVMLVRDYDVSVYAKLDKNGEPEKVVPTEKHVFSPIIFTDDYEGKKKMEFDGTDPWISEPFKDAEYVFYNKEFTLQPGEIRKYSILVWIEGWDEQCTNDIIGGLLKIDFAFEVIGG
ncbi:MAG: hypothetical protein J6V83_04215 [Clostridia bacterium]|nr:hypothetical protein [Clostridia bacterium]MBO7156591.1 hypothetical protein [Clostridia bacterium]